MQEVEAVVKPLRLFVRSDNKICMQMMDGDIWYVCDNKQTSAKELMDVVERSLDLGMYFYQQKINRVNSKPLIKRVK